MMTIKKWPWALAMIGIFVVMFILLTGTGERFVSNLTFIPAGSSNMYPNVNSTSETGMTGNATLSGDHERMDTKMMDANFVINEWNISSPMSHQRNITIIRITDDDFKGIPELERVMHKVKNNPPGWGSGWSLSITGFGGNQSDYYRFMNSVCENKTRLECYADLPAFEYYGRHYFIEIAVF